MRGVPASRAACAMSSHCSIDSSVPTRWLRRLKVSLTASAMPISPHPAALARSKPLRLSTKPMYRVSARPGQPREYLLCVRHLRDLDWIDEARDFDPLQSRRREPVDELDLDGRRKDPGSFCSPSRGPTSTISIDFFMRTRTTA